MTGDVNTKFINFMESINQVVKEELGDDDNIKSIRYYVDREGPFLFKYCVELKLDNHRACVCEYLYNCLDIDDDLYPNYINQISEHFRITLLQGLKNKKEEC